MSFILDALKKSENERQRQAGPSLADVRITKRDAERPWWAVAVAALLVINLGVLIIVLTRDDAPEEPASPAAPVAVAPPAPSSALPASRVPASPPIQQYGNPAVHPLADEALDRREPPVDPAIANNAALAAAASVPEGPPLVKPVNPPAVAPAAVPATATFEARSAPPPEVLPTSVDLAATGKSVPELHLDIHVYSANPAERFVLVNMRKYTEGQALNEGPTVERITTDGVVLNHRGLRYMLPRQ